MKKVVLCLLASILLVSLVFAQNESSLRERLRENAEERQELNLELRQNIREKIREGENLTIGDRKLIIRMLKNRRLQLAKRNFLAHTNLTLSQEDNSSEIDVELPDGKRRRLKIMPDTAALRALERLRLKNCNESNNCTIELKDVGHREGNESRIAYAIKAKKEARFLGLFRMRMDVESEVDAETGEVIRTRKPWWAFLASEKNEKPEIEEETEEGNETEE
jgi:hypothetical protein